LGGSLRGKRGSVNSTSILFRKDLAVKINGASAEAGQFPLAFDCQ